MTQYKEAWKMAALFRTYNPSCWFFYGTSCSYLFTFIFWLWFPKVQLVFMDALRPHSLEHVFCSCGRKTNSERVEATTEVLRLCHRGNECLCNSNTPDLTPTQQENFSNVLLFMVLPRQDVSCILYSITHIYELLWRGFKSWISKGYFIM